MNVTDFMRKWRESDLTERSGSQQHFCDLCELLDHPTPAEADPKGEWFTFEKGATKPDGSDGWADVWKKGFFGWEYKGKHKDLDEAYKQLLKYRESLENPPLLVVCDMERIIIHTNFTATAPKVHEVTLLGLKKPENLEIIKAVFHDPEKLRPGASREAITQKAANRLATVAQRMRERGLEPHKVARFLDRIVFCLFAEDIGLLPEGVFTELLTEYRHEPEQFTAALEELFRKMAKGGRFGVRRIKHFNGNLFQDVEVLPLEYEEIESVQIAATLDWDAVDASIFGTLFERGMDPSKRAQVGAHYTSRADIETLVEPVVMAPLRREWGETRQLIENLLTTGKKHPKQRDRVAQPPSAVTTDGQDSDKKTQPRAAVPHAERLRGARLRKARDEAVVIVNRFLERLSRVHVLDPACGSGNFLYVTLQMLKDLEKEVIIYAANRALGGFIPAVGPWQLHGIELSPYAYELAQLTVWIGYLQWLIHNGYDIPHKPILKPMHTFECKDAILDLTDPEHPREPTWPKVDFIVGNPPFLGGNKIRQELGSEYVDTLFALYVGRVPASSDLCCYWFEQARAHIEAGGCQRAGLLATQGIRGGSNREVLKRIKDTGGIFFAQSDRPWILDGAQVHVSLIGFDCGHEADRSLDGAAVGAITSSLTSGVDISAARPLQENAGVSFRGNQKGGAFDVGEETALQLMANPNPNSRPSSDVLKPVMSGQDFGRRYRNMWLIDFGCSMTETGAAGYQDVFEYAVEHVKIPFEAKKVKTARNHWWIHERPRPEMRASLGSLSRFIVTPHVSKHRVFAWLAAPVLPDHQLIAFGRPDDYCFGLLHSRPHETWARALGTQLRERESGFRYTPTTCFETFPFPEPTEEQAAAIAEAARELNALRERWLNPPEWVREEVLEFPGTVGGPWTRYIEEEGSGLQVPGARNGGGEGGSGLRVTGSGDGEDSATGGRNPEPETRNHPRTGTVRYPRLVPRDADCAKQLKKRTLTNLYNDRPTWLDLVHKKLDEAVFAAYGWDPAVSDEEILERLLALNLERAETPD